MPAKQPQRTNVWDVAVTVPRWVVFLFAAIIAVQAFHWAGHAFQTYQHWWLGLPMRHARGLTFFVDAEWYHFAFNTFYWISLSLLAVGLRIGDRRRWFGTVPYWSFIGGLAVSTYHELEHVVKIGQHVLFACRLCPGIFSTHFDHIYFHFVLNTTMLFLPIVAFVGWGFACRGWQFAVKSSRAQ